MTVWLPSSEPAGRQPAIRSAASRESARLAFRSLMSSESEAGLLRDFDGRPPVLPLAPSPMPLVDSVLPTTFSPDASLLTPLAGNGKTTPLMVLSEARSFSYRAVQQQSRAACLIANRLTAGVWMPSDFSRGRQQRFIGCLPGHFCTRGVGEHVVAANVAEANRSVLFQAESLCKCTIGFAADSSSANSGSCIAVETSSQNG